MIVPSTASSPVLETEKDLNRDGDQGCRGVQGSESDESDIDKCIIWLGGPGDTLSSAAGARVLMAPRIEGRTHEIHVDLVRPHEHHRQFGQPKLQMSLNGLKTHLNSSVGAAVRLMSHAKNSLRCKHSARLPMVCRREAKFYKTRRDWRI